MIDLTKIESLEECAELLANVEAQAAKERSYNAGRALVILPHGGSSEPSVA